MKGLTKEEFIRRINNIEEQFQHDNKCHKAFSTILKNDYVSNYDYNLILTDYIDMLEYIMDDKSQMITYFIYDLEFGKKYKDGMITEHDGTIIKLKTVEDLYNYLNK